MRFGTEFALWAVLLVALAANPVWFFPHAEQPAHEYRAVEITDTDSRPGHPGWHPSVRECYRLWDRECAFEAAALDGGVTVNSSAVESGDTFRYEYVLFSSGFYEPATESTDRGVRLTLEPRSAEAVLRNLSYPYADASEQARTVVRKGNATLRHEIPDRDRIIRRSGTYYAIQETGEKWQRHPRFFPELRWLMWLLTVPISVAAMWRWT